MRECAGSKAAPFVALLPLGAKSDPILVRIGTFVWTDSGAARMLARLSSSSLTIATWPLSTPNDKVHGSNSEDRHASELPPAASSDASS